jgi:VanZ family protein
VPDSAVRRWLPVIAWAALISILSTTWFSGEHTGGVIIRLLAALFPHADLGTLRAVHQGVRKAAHFGEYFVLSLLLARALRGDAEWSLGTTLTALGLAAVYAAGDELHQRFALGRVASAADCLIDISGAAAAQGLIAARRGTAPS